MIEVTTQTNTKVTDWLISIQKKSKNIPALLERYGQVGVDALQTTTPWRTGKTAMSWSYNVKQEGSNYILEFNNSNVVDGVNIALILQTGHPTRDGAWIEGRDYINPALQPIFDDILNKAWGEIKAL